MLFKLDKRILFFLLKALALYLLWYAIYDLWLFKVGWFDRLIIDNIIGISAKLLKVLDYPIFIYDQVIGIDGSHGVFIGVPCNGVEVMALFSGFIVLFKGKISHKISFIGIGVLIIHLINTLRVFLLIILAYYYPSYLDFNHKYTFTVFMYLIVFFGWMIWVNKYALIKK